MQKRREFKTSEPLDKRLSEEAARLRKEARGLRPELRAIGFCAERGRRSNRPYKRVAKLGWPKAPDL